MGENDRILIVSERTGEILRTYDEPINITTEAQRRASRKYFDQRKGNGQMAQYCKEQGGFVFGIYEIEKEYQSELTQQDIARLMMVATYLNYDGVLSHNNGKSINKKELMRVLKLSKNAFGGFYNKMIELEILVEDGEKIRINDRYFIKGKIEEKEDGLHYTRVFINGVRGLYNACKSRQHKQLGSIFKLLPYIHVKHNIVCHNPSEMNRELVKPMTLGEFAEIIGYGATNITTLRRNFYSFEIDGMKAFLFVLSGEDKRSYRMIVNPKILYAGGNIEDVGAILALFNR